MTIDVFNLDNMNKGESELQVLLIFSIMVAGKTAKVIEKQCYDFLFNSEYTRSTPFKTIQNMIDNNALESELKRAKTGQYKKLIHALQEIIKLDINNIALEDLENIKGIGKKTSRYFLIYAYDRKDIAAIDTHIEKWLKEKGYQSPSRKDEYEFFEKVFLEEARQRGKDPKDLDKEIWLSRARK